jgi:hypothetical protein
MGWVDWHAPPNEQSIADLTVAAEDISFTLEEMATATTLTINHFLVLVDASSGGITITLPASASHTNRIYTIKKIDSSGNKVTVDANASETIDGELTIDLKLQYSYITIVCDGTEWFIIGGGNVKLEDILEEKLDEIIDNTERLVIESKQQTLHQAVLSDEDFSEADIG